MRWQAITVPVRPIPARQCTYTRRPRAERRVELRLDFGHVLAGTRHAVIGNRLAHVQHAAG